MPVIIFNQNETKPLEKEPYVSLAKRIKTLFNNLDGSELIINISSNSDGFFNGFYTDKTFMNNAYIRFVFSEVAATHNYFVRMEYCFECNDDNYFYYQDRMRVLKRRVPYYYIPFITHFNFSYQISDEFKMQFDVLVKDKNDICDACFALLNQIIAIFSFEN